MLEQPPLTSATQRLVPRRQTIEDAYSPPANFLEIDVCRPLTHGEAKNRYTDYEVNLRTNLPVFALKESSVRRRYSDFEWLRNELDRESKIVVPKLPSKAWKRQLPFRADEGIFDDEFIEERRKGLEGFINNAHVTRLHDLAAGLLYVTIVVPKLPSKAWKRQLPFRADEGIFDDEFIEERRKGLEGFINKVAGHPLAQNEKCLHMFLQDKVIDRNYRPCKMRNL
ncbi:hypothetical protein AHF37_02514 [Paragonimus kellicotti]|nr:hypothetical protein AHF37_02514 [Paragonimus kellicotti]